MPPKFVQYEIMRQILKPRFLPTISYLVRRGQTYNLKPCAVSNLLQLYDFILEKKHILLRHVGLLNTVQKKCIKFAESDNVWFDTHYKSIRT